MVSHHRDNDAAEARAIMSALRAFQAHPELLDEARSNLPAALDRMGLVGIARHAVTAALTLSVSGILLVPATPVFWAV